MESFIGQYTRLYYEQLYKNIQQQQQIAHTPEIPKKKVSNFSMASILEPEQDKVSVPAPIIPIVPANYWELSGLSAMYNQPNGFGNMTQRVERVESRTPEVKAKRIRTIFTQQQIDRLEIEFEKSQYMIGSDRVHLARELSLSETQVKVWFQNRRIKSRKQKKMLDSAGEERSESSENESESSTTPFKIDLIQS